LKKFSDESNTNLYVSNIPRTLNEHELSNMFEPYKVLSARILRDEHGNGRGVGFARFDLGFSAVCLLILNSFETRDVCEDVIRKYNNSTIVRGEQDFLIQIRFSDTPEQKILKQQTAAARQFRAAEYDAGCAQVGHVMSPSTPHGFVTNHQNAGEFEQYLQSK
jgi:RNA recognition motif. (a.k.a. RRM, RBD, or RNP domain)